MRRRAYKETGVWQRGEILCWHPEDLRFLLRRSVCFPPATRMRASLVRSAGEALRRRASSSGTPSLAPSAHVLRRSYGSESTPERKVAILGAAGGIGQPLSLLMKLNPLVSHLSLYDIAGTPGVAADVSHINTRAQVSASGYAALVLLLPTLCCLRRDFDLGRVSVRCSSMDFCSGDWLRVRGAARARPGGIRRGYHPRRRPKKAGHDS